MRVEDPSPMKRGLKALDEHRAPFRVEVEDPSPMKRGLKDYISAGRGHIDEGQVEDPSPMKRGLKAVVHAAV